MTVPTTKVIAAATLQACYPEAPAAAINKALDTIATAAVTASVPGVVTADTIDQPRPIGTDVVHVQPEEHGDAWEPPAQVEVLPPVDAGCEIVTVEKFFDKTWPDSGRVRTLLLKRGDGSELKAKFDESRTATWKACCSAIGCKPDDTWREIQGQRAVVEIVDWTNREGGTMPIVRRWVARPGSPRAIEKQAAAASKASRAEARRSRNAVQHQGDDLPF